MEASPRTNDSLVVALLPVVVHELNNATQMLTSYNALFGMPEGAALLEARAEDLASVGEELQELGWLVGALASSAGQNLLLARRRADGLGPLVRMLRKGLRRQSKDLVLPESELPHLSVTHGAGWEVVWAVGTLLWSAASRSMEPLRWAALRAPGGYAFEMEAEVEDPTGFAERLTRDVEGAQLETPARLFLPDAYWAAS